MHRALSWLGAPMRTDRVELTSSRPAAEVRARIEAASRPADGYYGWYKGGGVVRRHRGETIRLAVARTYGSPMRPEASVVIEPAGSGARVAAEIELPAAARMLYVVNGVAALVMGLLFLRTALTLRASGPLVGVLLCVLSLGFPLLMTRDRGVMRALLNHAVS